METRDFVCAFICMSTPVTCGNFHPINLNVGIGSTFMIDA